eukprot:TRINITY_DN17958_c0_g1_i1.p1 TRINITY_DN17958_c0_g1~~TRINITY_DN17958_c0_g1_i1.p1  ORF type:complete len:196 (+),score=45.57 TRINITY_DN17958_c0_g1_i1:67-588(+)
MQVGAPGGARHEMAAPQEPAAGAPSSAGAIAGGDMPSVGMAVYVYVGEQAHEVEATPDSTVGDLMRQLAAVVGRDCRPLTYQGKTMLPSALLADEGIGAEGVLYESAPGKPRWHPEVHGPNVEISEDGSCASLSQTTAADQWKGPRAERRLSRLDKDLARLFSMAELPRPFSW